MIPLLFALALAQAPARVEGTVVNAATGEPLGKADVTLYRAESVYSAVSDASGRFVIENVQPGTYGARGSRAGFLPAPYGARRPAGAGVSLTLSAGQEVKDIVFRLVAQGVIAGRVVDEDGDPLPDVLVTALRRGYPRSGLRWSTARVARANDIGEFRLANLAPGKYIVLSSSRPRPRHDEDGDTDLLPAYYPNTPDASQAIVLDIASGQTLSGIEVRLVRARVVRVSGRVLLPGGAPAAHAHVELSTRGLQPGSGVPSALTAPPDGRFTINNVAPGSYLISARVLAAGDTGESSPSQPIEVSGQNVDGLVIQLLAPRRLEGRLTVQGPIKPDFSSFEVSFAGIGVSAIAEVKAARDGSFTVELKPGTYIVQVIGDTDTWLKSIKFGGAEVKDHTLDLTGGGASPLEVLLGSDPARINGRVTDSNGNPVLGARVVLLPGGLTQTSGRDGSFTFKGVAPGAYTLYAWDDVEDGVWFDLEFLKLYEGKAVPIKVQAGDTAAVTIEAQQAQQ